MLLSRDRRAEHRWPQIVRPAHWAPGGKDWTASAVLIEDLKKEGRSCPQKRLSHLCRPLRLPTLGMATGAHTREMQDWAPSLFKDLTWSLQHDECLLQYLSWEFCLSALKTEAFSVLCSSEHVIALEVPGRRVSVCSVLISSWIRGCIVGHTLLTSAPAEFWIKFIIYINGSGRRDSLAEG